MSTPDITEFLAEREREAESDLMRLRTEMAQLEREAAKRQGTLESVRRWRNDLVKAASAAPANGQPKPVAQAPAKKEPNFDVMPDFDSGTDPTGKRRAIWEFLDEQRGERIKNPDLRAALVRLGKLPESTTTKDIAITTRRMAAAGQIKKGGRGVFGLPKKTAPDPEGEGGPI